MQTIFKRCKIRFLYNKILKYLSEKRDETSRSLWKCNFLKIYRTTLARCNHTQARRTCEIAKLKKVLSGSETKYHSSDSRRKFNFPRMYRTIFPRFNYTRSRRTSEAAEREKKNSLGKWNKIAFDEIAIAGLEGKFNFLKNSFYNFYTVRLVTQPGGISRVAKPENTPAKNETKFDLKPFPRS